MKIHEDLIGVSVHKTEIVKDGLIEKLQPLLVKERKYTQMLEQAEVKRKREVDTWFLHQQLPVNDATITQMLEVLTEKQEKEKLENMMIALTEAITKLKQQEQLNYALIQQSMQFVQLSLEMLNPTIKNMNYGKKKQTNSAERSVFDSKA